MPSSIKQLAAEIDAIIFDVDGVLTRGEIIHGSHGELKVFNVQDGHGFALARRAGLKTAFLSGRASEAVRIRASELHVDVHEEGVRDKARVIHGVLEKLGVEAEKTCYVGDDLVDIPPMRKVGLSIAVANAADEVKEVAMLVTQKRGGEGAAREVIELILKARGSWPSLMERYLKDEDEG